MANTDHKSVDDYIAAQPAQARRVLGEVRAAIRKALPGATEGISYQIPVYKLDGAMVLYFAGFREHYSIYPASARLIAELEDELADRLHSKATVRFPLDQPVPARLITRIAKLRAAEVAELRMAKRAKTMAGKKAAAKKPAAKKPAAKRPAAKATSGSRKTMPKPAPRARTSSRAAAKRKKA